MKDESCFMRSECGLVIFLIIERVIWYDRAHVRRVNRVVITLKSRSANIKTNIARYPLDERRP